MNEASEAAAMYGLAENLSMPVESRLACALKALKFYSRGQLDDGDETVPDPPEERAKFVGIMGGQP